MFRGQDAARELNCFSSRRLCFRLTIAFVAYEISNEIDYSKAVHSGDNDYNLVVQSLRKRLVSRLGVTDRNHFDFQSFFSDFADLRYSGLVNISSRYLY